MRGGANKLSKLNQMPLIPLWRKSKNMRRNFCSSLKMSMAFLATVKLVDPTSVPPFFVRLYDYAWFVGFAIAFVVYLVLRKLARVTSDT